MLCFKPCLRPKSLSMSYSFGLYTIGAVLPSKVGGNEYDRQHIRKSCGGDSSLPPQDLTLMGKQTASIPLPEVNTTLGGRGIGLTCDGCAVILKLRLLTLGECYHILLYLVVCNFSVNLCGINTAMSEHLTERLHRNTIG